jgi:hypothetical protein
MILGPALKKAALCVTDNRISFSAFKFSFNMN